MKSLSVAILNISSRACRNPSDPEESNLLVQKLRHTVHSSAVATISSAPAAMDWIFSFMSSVDFDISKWPLVLLGCRVYLFSALADSSIRVLILSLEAICSLIMTEIEFIMDVRESTPEITCSSLLLVSLTVICPCRFHSHSR
jgi:hypothetical protein